MTKEEIKKIEDDKAVKYCYIRKGPYYRPNACGYTDYVSRAGVYSKDEAVKMALSCDELRLVPIDIDDHNAMLTLEILELESRLITL